LGGGSASHWPLFAREGKRAFADALLKLEDINEEEKLRNRVQNCKSVMCVTSDNSRKSHFQINSKKHQTNWTLN